MSYTRRYTKIGVGTARLRTARLRTARVWTTRLRDLKYFLCNLISIMHRPIVRGWARAPPEMPRPKNENGPLVDFFRKFFLKILKKR